uniref:Uncharacterized protein n=1 Tax=Ditylenchus dipsaci TaxID=166011 RepID=A0A915D358_9BILA
MLGCPNGCVCSSATVVCSCDEAFRGIRKSPRQFVVQNFTCASAGRACFGWLSSIEHFWFRNVTIERISKLAFSKLSNIKYLYFREASIEIIEAGAFAHMKGIQHFYMREKIHISSISDHIFVGSSINELIFENAQIRSTDLSFVGLNAQQVSFINCRIHSQKRSHLRRIAVQTVENFQARNSSFNRVTLKLAIFLHLLNLLQILLLHIGQIKFKRCFINQWHSYAFNSARNIGLILLKNSRILAFHRHAIYNSHINKLLLQNTRVKSVDREAFPNNFFGSIELNEVDVLSVGLGAFSSTNILEKFLIQRTNIHFMQEGVFAHMNIPRLIVAQSSFGKFPTGVFEATNCSSLTIDASKFGDFFNSSIFTNLRTTRQLSVSHSEFICSPSACEQNSMLLHSSIHNLAWKFSNNRCTADHTTETREICAEEIQTYNSSGLVCRRRASIEECICVENEARGSIGLPETSATILVLGDCPKVIVDGLKPEKKLEEGDNSISHSHQPNLQFLYLYRIPFVDIVSVEKSLKQLHLLYSTIYFNKARAFENIQLDELVISGSTVNHVTENSFSSSQIGALSINGTTINHVDEDAFTGSHIQLVQLLRSKLVSIGNLFNFADRLRIEDSLLPGRQHEIPERPSKYMCSTNNLTKLANSTANTSCYSAGGSGNLMKRCANNNKLAISKDCHDMMVNRCEPMLSNTVFTAYCTIIALTISTRFASNIILV